jgi:hypothetical protein
MIKHDLEEFIKVVINCLAKSNIKYVIVGGLAAILYGRPRTTIDVDIIIDYTSDDEIEQLETILRENGFSLQQNEIVDALKEQSHCSIFLADCVFRIDLQGLYSSIDKRALDNRVSMRIFNEKTYIEKIEDVIIGKLVYGSPIDYEDIVAIAIRQKNKINLEYLHSIAKIENVEKKLQEILLQVEL